MDRKQKPTNPAAFIGAGVVFMSVGIALWAPAWGTGQPGAGPGVFSLGFIFLVFGLAQKRRAGRGDDGDGDG